MNNSKNVFYDHKFRLSTQTNRKDSVERICKVNENKTLLHRFTNQSLYLPKYMTTPTPLKVFKFEENSTHNMFNFVNNYKAMSHFSDSELGNNCCLEVNIVHRLLFSLSNPGKLTPWSSVFLWEVNILQAHKGITHILNATAHHWSLSKPTNIKATTDHPILHAF